ncbi:MAG: enoyl-CoA hydratase-related protein [Actinomycetota bacterium]
MAEFVRLEVRDRVGTIRLDRPPANAINAQVSKELLAAALEGGAREDVAALVVWGGPKIFAAGADIKEVAAFDPHDIRPVVTALGDALVVLEELPKVVVAAIEGYALGGGCELALACDLRIASPRSQLGQSEIKLGIIPGAGGTQRLPRLIGRSRARELIYSGRIVPAEEALAIGLVDRLEPDPYAAAFEQAARFAQGPTRALAAAKEALNAADLGDLRKGLSVERDVFVGLFDTRDQREGMQAFLEKRDPTFEGR